MGAATSIEDCLPLNRDSQTFKTVLEALRGVIVGYEEHRRARVAEEQAAAILAAEKAGEKPPKFPPEPTDKPVPADVSDSITVSALREVLVDGSRRSLSTVEFDTMLEDIGIDSSKGNVKISLADVARVSSHLLASLRRGCVPFAALCFSLIYFIVLRGFRSAAGFLALQGKREHASFGRITPSDRWPSRQ